VRVPRVAPDLVNAAALVAERTTALGRPMHLLASTTSTNDEAKRGAKEAAPHGSTWVAEEQTAGRGRQGRAWTSPPGENLLFSVLLRVTCPPARLPPVAIAVGLAVRDAVVGAAPGSRRKEAERERSAVESRPTWELDARLKWPNDVLVDGRKLAGILVEAVTVGSRVEAVIVGVGINVHTRDFPAELVERATSLALVAPGPFDRAVILADVLERIDRDVHVVVARGLGLLRARLDAGDALRGRRVRNDGGDEGEACGIDEDGRLLVRRGDGVTARWSAGEVHLVGRG
jgi:BirA family transcriptional regulator, biotin operon repressor / biotin---[acetyl-CoA-carboxylase] ligase